MIRIIGVILVLVASSAVPSIGQPQAGAAFHPGGLNSQGCHAGSRPYHCHRSPSQMRPSSSGGNRLRCDLGSRSQDCVGRNTPSTSTQSRANIRRLQTQLYRHCSGLSSGFVDGMDGSATLGALLAFQEAYGIEADGLLGQQTDAALSGPVNGQCQVN